MAYKEYRASLKELSQSNNSAKQELSDCENIFKENITNKGIECFDRADYALSCQCFTALAEFFDLSNEILFKYVISLFELNQNDIAKEILEKHFDCKKETPDNIKSLSDYCEKAAFHKLSCDYMETYLNSKKDDKTKNDYISYAVKLHLLYNENFEFPVIEKSIEYFNKVLKINKKDIDFDSAKDILHIACITLVETSNPSDIYVDLLNIFGNVGMLNEQAYCFRMLINANSRICSGLAKLIDKYRAIAQIMCYFNQYKMLSDVLSANEYFKKLESIILQNGNLDKTYKDEIAKIKKYTADELKLNEDNLFMNELAIELNPDCKEAYFNLINYYISSNEYNTAYEVYAKYCTRFNIQKKEDVANMLYQISDFYKNDNLHFKSVKYQQYAIEYELNNGETK